MRGWMRKAAKGEGRSQGRLPGGGHVWYMVWCVFVVGVYGVVVEETMCTYVIPGVRVCGIWYMCAILGVCVYERERWYGGTWLYVIYIVWYMMCVLYGVRSVRGRYAVGIYNVVYVCVFL